MGLGRRVLLLIIAGMVLAGAAGVVRYRDQLARIQRDVTIALREPTVMPLAPAPAYPPPVLRSVSGLPSTGATGTLQVDALAEGEAIVAVRFVVDGPQPLLAEDREPPYRLGGEGGWDISRYPAGSYTLTTTAINAAGESEPTVTAFTIAEQPAVIRSPLAFFIDDWNAGWRAETSGATANLAAGTAHNGMALSVTFDAPAGELTMRAAEPVAAAEVAVLRFWVNNGDAAAQQLGLVLYDAAGNPGTVVPLPQPLTRWYPVEVPIAALGAPAEISAVGLRNLSETSQRPIFLDDITFEYLPVDLAAVAPPTATFEGSIFRETFDGAPSAPTPWRSANWDTLAHSRDSQWWQELEPAEAAYGPACEADGTHTVTRYDGTVYQCADQLLTSINSSASGAVVLTPNALVDFAAGEAVVRWKMSTVRTSDRDWVDIWITPYDEQLQLPMESSRPDGQGPPRRAIHLRMETPGSGSRATFFRVSVVRDFEESRLPISNRPYDEVLTPSASDLSTFELRISRTTLRFGLPDQNLWWYDGPIDDLGWDQGVVQFSHLSESPAGCGTEACGPNTWRWDDIEISPARPISVIQSDTRQIDPDDQRDARFFTPAPDDAMLRFLAIGAAIEVSFDGGESWQPAQQQTQEGTATNHFRSYWMPVPPGVQLVRFRGKNIDNQIWLVRVPTIWSRR